MNIFLATLKILKFPLKLLAKLVRKKPKKTELEQKQWKHVRNFSPTHYSWQQKASKSKKKKNKLDKRTTKIKAKL